MAASASYPMPAPSSSSVAQPAGAKASRLLSLDALRGFDMLWILGVDSVSYAFRGIKDPSFDEREIGPFDHADWAGFTFYDLIFPLFIFIVGVSAVFSLAKILAQHGRSVAVRRILVRAGLLFLLGIFYNGGLSQTWPDVRVAGVLQRIAIAYAGAGLLLIFLRPRGLVATAAAILVGYWVLLTFVPVRDIQLEPAALAVRLGPDEGAAGRVYGLPSPAYQAQVEALFDATTARVTGKYEPGLNLANHLDFRFLPGSMYDVYWDPEGLLGTLPAIATCLLGVLAGLLLRRQDFPGARKALWLAGAGLVLLVLGHLWGFQFPVVKKIWTSSFVFVAGGWSLLLLAAFYYIIDVRQWRHWCPMFLWIGMNPITLYLAAGAFGFHGIARRLVGGDVEAYFDASFGNGAGEVVIASVMLVLLILLARFLYRRGIFLRV